MAHAGPEAGPVAPVLVTAPGHTNDNGMVQLWEADTSPFVSLNWLLDPGQAAIAACTHSYN
jgi:hypothetical protein